MLSCIPSYGLYSYGPYRCGPYSYGPCSYGPYSYGPCSYGLYSYGLYVTLYPQLELDGPRRCLGPALLLTRRRRRRPDRFTSAPGGSFKKTGQPPLAHTTRLRSSSVFLKKGGPDVLDPLDGALPHDDQRVVARPLSHDLRVPTERRRPQPAPQLREPPERVWG